MPLNIKDADTQALTKRLASLTGESLTQAVKQAVQERLAQVEKTRRAIRLADELDHMLCIALICLATTGGVRNRSSVITNEAFRSDGGRHIGTHRHHAKRTGTPPFQ